MTTILPQPAALASAGSRRYMQVDGFGAERFRGNALAVVIDGDGLDDKAMERIARWTQLSETAFLLPPTAAAAARGADYRVRIRTPGGELSFAGHPTLGSCHAWLCAGGLPQAAGRVVQECGIGLVTLRPAGAPDGTVAPVAALAADGAGASRLAFEAPPLVRTTPDAALVARVLAALGADASTLREAQWLDNGPQWLGLLFDSAATVLALDPDPARLKPLAQVGAVGPHRAGSSDCAFEVRAFAPSIGIDEDPVTGSLNAGLGQWLIGDGRAPERYVAAQGTRLGRAGRVAVERIDGRVWVGGRSLTCIEGRLTVG